MSGTLNSISKYVAVREESSAVELVQTLSGKTTVVTPFQWSKIAAGARTEVLKGISSVLLEDRFFVPQGTDEQRDLISRIEAEKGSKERFQAIIFPTEKCNLRCTYCYEDFSIGKMQQDVQENLIDFLKLKALEYDGVSTAWFGGEPLLAMDVIENVHYGIIPHLAKHRRGFSSQITTNAYFLNAQNRKKLLALGVNSFQITLDGTRQSHNARRRIDPRSNADSDTYSKIISHIHGLSDEEDDFLCVIRLNYDRENIDDLKAEMQKLSESLDARFKFDFSPVWGNSKTYAFGLFEGLERHSTFIDFIKYANDLGIQTVNNRLHEFGAESCYAANPHSVIVRASGQLNKCTVALDAPENQVGSLSKGGLAQMDNAKVELWCFDGAMKDPVCGSCWNAPSCQGNSCPLVRITEGRRPCPPRKTQSVKVP